VTRVLLVHQPIDGGVARHVADLTAGLPERGYEVTLCGPGLPEGVPADTPHARLALGRAVAPGADAAAAWRFARLVSDLEPDLIHAHSSKAGAVARLSRVLTRKAPVLYTPHGYAFAGYFERELERRVYREAERALGGLTSMVVAVCEAEARLARTVAPTDRVRVVHNGIDSTGEGPADERILSLAERGPVICTLTLLRPGKGVETLIDAMPTVLSRAPSAQLAIVGGGPDRHALEERSRKRGVHTAAHFLGPSTEPLAALRAADVFVLPSWAEAFPYVILEAMSVGRAIVASDIGGIGEAIENGRSGVLVAPRDPPALAHALVGVLEDGALRDRLGDAAHRRVAERFTLERMLDGTARVYGEL